MNMHASIAATANHATWAATLAARNDAELAYDEHATSVWKPISDEVDRVAPRPDLFFDIEARSGRSARFFVSPSDLHGWDDHWSPMFREKAGAIRDKWLEHRAHCERLGWDAAGDECERLCSIQCAFEEQLILMPAPDLPALRWKLDHLFGEELKPGEYCAAWCAEWTNAVMADVRRLLGSLQPDVGRLARRMARALQPA